jgi:hypothetical protein
MASDHLSISFSEFLSLSRPLRGSRRHAMSLPLATQSMLRRSSQHVFSSLDVSGLRSATTDFSLPSIRPSGKSTIHSKRIQQSRRPTTRGVRRLPVPQCVRPIWLARRQWKGCDVLALWRLLTVWHCRYATNDEHLSTANVSSGLPTYDGSAFAEYEDVIVVTTNYRTNG